MVAALGGIPVARIVLINREHLYIGERDVAFLELPCEVGVEGHRGLSCCETKFECAGKRCFPVILDGFDNDVCHPVAADGRVIKNLGGDLLIGVENALRQVLLNQSTVFW